MIIICLLILLFFIIGAKRNYHNAILTFAPLYVAVQDYLCIKYSAPAVSLSFALEFIFIAFAYGKNSFKWSQFPLKKQFLCLFVVVLFSISYSRFPISSTLPWVIDLLSSYLIVVLYYNQIKSKDDVLFSLKVFFALIWVFVIYGVFEYIIQSNPVMEYVESFIPEEWGGTLYITEDIRYSSVRCQSLMTICISWGGLCCLATGVLFYVRDSLFPNRKLFFWLLLGLLILCVYSSGTRSSYVYLVIVLIGSFTGTRGAKNKVFFIFVGCLAVYYLSSSIYDIYLSMTSAGSDISGSNSDMRMMQWYATLATISESPVIGLGCKGVIVGQKLNSEILGAESVWFQILLSYGFIGMFMQAYLYYGCIRAIFVNSENSKKIQSILFVLGWIAFSSISSSPGLTEPYFLMILMLVIRYAKFEKIKDIY